MLPHATTTLVGKVLKVGAGGGLTVTVCEHVVIQPFLVTWSVIVNVAFAHTVFASTVTVPPFVAVIVEAPVIDHM